MTKEKIQEIIAALTEQSMTAGNASMEIPDNIYTDKDGRLIVAEVTRDALTIYGLAQIQEEKETQIRSQVALAELEYKYEVKELADTPVLVVSVRTELTNDAAYLIEHILGRLMVITDETKNME